MGKTVVLGVTGSIAAYKAAEITSRLKKEGIAVRVILTAAGAHFITPLTLETLSLAPVSMDQFSRETPYEVEHIALAQAADVFLVAPATANFLGKAANGIADDLLTSVFLATRAPVLIAPAMNDKMYTHPAVQQNIEALRARGCSFIEPGVGLLACGDVGVGRLAEVDDIVDAVLNTLGQKRDLAGKRILVSAGPTCEQIDPVRYITNRSSGKMGYALAEAAQARGAEVTLVSGPVHIPVPAGVTCIDVRSSADMCAALEKEFAGCDALIMAAAPADFTPQTIAEQKIKKAGAETLTLTLGTTTDILKRLGTMKTHQRTMGFAAETQDLDQNARGKLESKNLDFIAANDVSASDRGFAVDKNAVTLYARDGSVRQSEHMSKRDLADWLLDALVTVL